MVKRKKQIQQAAWNKRYRTKKKAMNDSSIKSIESSGKHKKLINCTI